MRFVVVSLAVLFFANPWVVTNTPAPTPAVCAGDVNRDGTVTIAELIQAVNAALRGCP